MSTSYEAGKRAFEAEMECWNDDDIIIMSTRKGTKSYFYPVTDQVHVTWYVHKRVIVRLVTNAASESSITVYKD